MPDKSNSPFQFWQELRRRKVVRRNTVYAATAFVILELVSIIEDPLKLPEWTMLMVIVLLSIGFLVSLILSWIYDFTPEGVQKIKSVKEIHKEVPEKKTHLKAWKIATYISVAVIVGFIVFNIEGRSKQAEDPTILEKSIAVLPFKYMSDESEKQYLADGAMDDIILHLSKVEDLRVMSRTSVEQYRETDKTATIICQELDVAYLLEGSFQKHGDQVRLIVQLITPGKEGHIWANEYNRNWKDIFSVQSEVAQNIARELHAVITPEEKQLIEKKPTTSLTAYDFYQRGREEYLNLLDRKEYSLSGTFFRGEDLSDITESMENAKDLYYKALEYDPTFAQAYTGLAWLYRHEHYWDTYFSENFLDSVLILADIALSYDDQLAEAYTVKGEYYRVKGITTQAIEEYDKAIKFNPNDWRAYNGKGMVYEIDDLVKAIENFHRAASLYHGSELPSLLRSISHTYQFAGITEKANYYLNEAFKLDGDSVAYYEVLGHIAYGSGNYIKAIEYFEKGYAIDTINTSILDYLGMSYMILGQFEESLKYFEKLIERLKDLEILNLNNLVEIGYVYWQHGKKEKADYYFNEQIDYCNRINELGRSQAQQKLSFYDLAAVYAFRGEKKKAYENLKVFNQRPRMPFWAVNMIKDEPLFDSLRDEPEFQQIIRDVEAKYQAEHERVRKWLEENDML